MSPISTDIDAAVRILLSGGLVGLPTETVYGLAADATDADAVRRVFAAKGRPADHPLIVHVAGGDLLGTWGVDVPDEARLLVERWWPGPLTLLLQRSDRVLDVVTGGRDTVALRSPSHPMALSVLRAIADRTHGGGLVAPSANRFGRVSPTTAADVVTELGSAVDLVLDGGACEIGIESTIVDLSARPFRVLRPGYVTVEQIVATIGSVELAGVDAPAVAPGMLAAHYAPDARLVLLAPDASHDDVEAAVRPLLESGRRVGVLAPAAVEGLAVDVHVLEPAGAADAYARALYSRLRQADAEGLDVLVVVPPEPVGAGVAVLDRLRRAAHRPPGVDG